MNIDWTLVARIFLGVFSLYFTCGCYALIEEHWKQRRREREERDYWKRRIERVRRGGS